MGRRGCGSPFHSRAVRPARRSSGTRSLPGSGCRRSARGAMSSPWQSQPGKTDTKALRAKKKTTGAEVPGPTSPASYLPGDGLLAGPTDPFGNRGDPQLVQVGLQTSQHAVKLAPRLGEPPGGWAAPSFPLRHELWAQGRLVRFPGPGVGNSQHNTPMRLCTLNRRGWLRQKAVSSGGGGEVTSAGSPGVRGGFQHPAV